MNFLKDLNDRQREAAETLTGSLLIVAGAGSGKTRTLTYRIANLIAQRVATPWQILAVTFTNKAAEEMKNRIERLLSQEFDLSEKNRPMIGTFHSICVRILRRHFDKLGREKSFVIYDSDDSRSLMKRIMKEKSIEDDRVTPQGVLGMISKAKNRLQNSSDFTARAGNYFERLAADLFKEYEARLVKNNAVDFDDLLFCVVELFRKHPAVLEEYQERWRFINIDEYQDTNHAQYILVKLLAAKYRNVCVIGDSDQSIYRFRGADLQNILDFEKDYPEAKAIKLEQNYRSTQNILNVADAVIGQNKHRKAKKMWTKADKGDLIEVWHCRNEEDEARRIGNEIERLRIEEKATLKDIVVLYRTHAQSRVIEEALLRYGMPYKVIGGVKFYARREVKDLLAYLRVILNPSDTESLARILNVPGRGVGETTIQKLQAFALARSLHLGEVMNHIEMVEELGERQKNSLVAFGKSLIEWREKSHQVSVSSLLKLIVKDIHYQEYLLDGTEEGEMRLENVLEFISVSEKYDGLEGVISLASFLEEVALVAEADAVDQTQETLTLMTLHSVKGLEYPYVFIVGCEENVFPHSRSVLEPADLEEERRLMYVGITRAMKKLYLFAAKERHLFGDYQRNPLSRFINDIPEHLINVTGVEKGRKPKAEFIDLKIRDDALEAPIRLKTAEERFRDGDRVLHKSFGVGMVVERRGDLVTIAFDDKKTGIKKFAAHIAPLEKLE
ncbi:MAG: UvrD-helicase domain-containing protein [Candidatus Peregrinibacteria bacterium]